MDRKRIGFHACLEAIGEDYASANRDNMVFSCGETEKGLYCFLGISSHHSDSEQLCLRVSIDEWEYYASCYVTSTNEVIMDKCKLPLMV